jgi:hypothetical protein
MAQIAITIPEITPANGGAPLAKAMPRHSSNATKILLNLMRNQILD